MKYNNILKIKKYADPIDPPDVPLGGIAAPDAPLGGIAAPDAPPNNIVTTNNSDKDKPSISSKQSAFSSNIKAMQAAMISAANVLKFPTFGVDFSYSGLNRFLVGNFLKSKVQKLEGPEDAATSVSTKTFSELLRKISMIGGSRAPTVPDGIWGPKTQEGLESIYAMSEMIISFNKELGEPASQLPDADLTKLNSLITGDGDKNARAKEITPILGEVKSLFSGFIEKFAALEQVGRKPGAKPGAKPGEKAEPAKFTTYKKSEAPATVFTEAEQNFINKNEQKRVNVNISTVPGAPMALQIKLSLKEINEQPSAALKSSIFASALADTAARNAFIQKFGKDNYRTEMQNTINSFVDSNITTMLNELRPQFIR